MLPPPKQLCTRTLKYIYPRVKIDASLIITKNYKFSTHLQSALSDYFYQTVINQRICKYAKARRYRN
jgi:hypothetical protein